MSPRSGARHGSRATRLPETPPGLFRRFDTARFLRTTVWFEQQLVVVPNVLFGTVHNSLLCATPGPTQPIAILLNSGKLLPIQVDHTPLAAVVLTQHLTNIAPKHFCKCPNCLLRRVGLRHVV